MRRRFTTQLDFQCFRVAETRERFSLNGPYQSYQQNTLQFFTRLCHPCLLQQFRGLVCSCYQWASSPPWLKVFCESYVLAVQTGRAIPMQEFTADLKHRMRGVWRDAELVDPNTHNNKLATYHSWFAIPFSRNERMPIMYHGISILICPNMLRAI